MPRRRLTAAFAVPVLMAGCGTVQNFARNGRAAEPYGGLEIAADRLEETFDGRHSQGNTIGPLILAGVQLSDVILSLVGDTISHPLCRKDADPQTRSDGRTGPRR